jgi:hypothetical protein
MEKISDEHLPDLVEPTMKFVDLQVEILMMIFKFVPLKTVLTLNRHIHSVVLSLKPYKLAESGSLQEIIEFEGKFNGSLAKLLEKNGRIWMDSPGLSVEERMKQGEICLEHGWRIMGFSADCRKVIAFKSTRAERGTNSMKVFENGIEMDGYDDYVVQFAIVDKTLKYVWFICVVDKKHVLICDTGSERLSWKFESRLYGEINPKADGGFLIIHPDSSFNHSVRAESQCP